MRLFVSLRPPDEVLAHLVAATAVLREADPRLRWTSPERLHLTLAFFGDVEPRRCPGLSVRLGRAATRAEPLRLRLHGGRRLGSVVSCRIGGAVAGLSSLADACSAAARRAGLDVQTRPFTPHLTVARPRSTSHRPDLRPAVEALAGYEGPWWTAEAIELVQSRLGSTPHYETLHRWLLGPHPSRAPSQV